MTTPQQGYRPHEGTGPGSPGPVGHGAPGPGFVGQGNPGQGNPGPGNAGPGNFGPAAASGVGASLLGSAGAGWNAIPIPVKVTAVLEMLGGLGAFIAGISSMASEPGRTEYEGFATDFVQGIGVSLFTIGIAMVAIGAVMIANFTPAARVIASVLPALPILLGLTAPYFGVIYIALALPLTLVVWFLLWLPGSVNAALKGKNR